MGLLALLVTSTPLKKCISVKRVGCLGSLQVVRREHAPEFLHQLFHHAPPSFYAAPPFSSCTTLTRILTTGSAFFLFCLLVMLTRLVLLSLKAGKAKKSQICWGFTSIVSTNLRSGTAIWAWVTIRCLREVEGEVKGKTLACLQLHAMRDHTAGSRLYSLQATALQKLDSSGGLGCQSRL